MLAGSGMVAPEETLPALGDGFPTPPIRELDLESSGIDNAIWATSYAFDFSLVKLPVLDGEGCPSRRPVRPHIPVSTLSACPGFPWPSPACSMGLAITRTSSPTT
jgi:hypothetical protein